MSSFLEIKNRSIEMSSNPNMDSCKLLILSVISLLDPKINNVDLSSFELFTDRENKLTANGSWFTDDTIIKDRKATYKIHSENSINIDFKLYCVNSLNKRIISWSQALTPNFEDEPFNTQFAVGIDFIVPKSYDRVIIVLSNNYAIRTLELSGNLTPTFEEIFSKWASLSDFTNKRLLHTVLWESFDLHPINKEFYEGISERFIALRQYLVDQKIFDDKHASQFSNRLIGRLVFCWFMRKKNYISEDFGYFDSSLFEDDTRYYKEKLEKLFFEVLNKPLLERRVEDTNTPYLNGGLFEEKSDDLVQDKALTFPKNYFDDFYSFLKSYNFTTDESTSQFQQVAIDPEMLGRIFENLLAEIIEDSGAQARKAKGAFYTPREIVDYMCRESLKNYLLTAFPSDPNIKQRLDQLIDGSDRDFQDQDHNWRRDWKPYKDKLMEALDDLRVIDPACGSGAYPMGMLQLLIKVYERLEPRLDMYKSKLRIISNNLYGVDIEPMAVEISRLRAWLSLVVDLEVDSKHIKPLPNLDFKFVCANSLIPLDKPTDVMFGEDPEFEKKLEEIRSSYFATEDMEKKYKFRSKYEQMILGNESMFGETRRTSQLRSYHPFDSGSVASFFDSKQMFGVPAFDIVIGNPPYVKVEHLAESTIKELRSNYSEVRNDKVKQWADDLYVHFIFRSYELLTSRGIVCLITNDSFIGLDSKARVRNKLLDENLIQLIRCPKETFGATIYTAIFLTVRSEKNSDAYMGAKFSLGSYGVVEPAIVHKTYIEKLPNSRFVLNEDRLASRLLTLDQVSSYLSIIDTGIDSGNVRSKLFFAEKSEGISKRLLQGRQIQRWAIWWNSPVAKFKYCDPTYIPSDNLGIGRGGRTSDLKEYWSYRRGGDEKYHYLPERILMRQTADTIFAAYHNFDEDGQFYTDNTLFTVVLKDEGSLKYFLGILNSKLIHYIYQFLSSEEGKIFAAVKTGLVDQLPMVYDKKLESKVVNLVTELIDARRKNPLEDVSQIELKLDLLVCEIFGLNEEERKLILQS